jgi:SAM-dependent methyltransferase
MYEAIVPALRCTACGGALELTEAQHDGAGEVIGGALRCQACPAGYPIRDGIADMLGAPRITSFAQLTNELPPTAWAYERLWRPFALSLLSGAPFPYSRELPLMLDMAEPTHGLHLDIACSNGLYARALAQRLGEHGHVAAIDHTMPMLLEGRQRARAAGLSISFVRAKAQQLPFQTECAQGVAIGGSLNEAGDLEHCLAEVQRVLTPGGCYVAMTLTSHPGWLERKVQHMLALGGIRFWSTDQLVERFEAHGLHVVERQQFGIVLFTRAHRGGDAQAH